MQDFNKECAASSDKGSEPVVLCSKMVRIAAAFLKETDSEGYEMLCEGLAKALQRPIPTRSPSSTSTSSRGELVTLSRLNGTFRPSSSGTVWRSRAAAARSSSPGPRRVRVDGASE